MFVVLHIVKSLVCCQRFLFGDFVMGSRQNFRCLAKGCSWDLFHFNKALQNYGLEISLLNLLDIKLVKNYAT